MSGSDVIASLVRVRGWRGGIALVLREVIRVDERRWVLVCHGQPRETRWVPKDETEPVVFDEDQVVAAGAHGERKGPSMALRALVRLQNGI